MRGIGSGKDDALIDWVCPVNWLAPLNRGLVHWYLCLPGLSGGSRLPDLCRRAVGILTGMDPPTDWLSGADRPGGWGCLDFDGTNDYVEMTTTIFNSATNISFAFWVYRPTTSVTVYLQAGDSGNADRLGMEWNSTTFYFVDRGGFPSFSISNAAGWYHVVLTFDSSKNPAKRVYLNSDERSLGSNTSASLPTDVNVLRVGRSAASTYSTGRFDDVRIYNRTLSGSEAALLYHASRAGYQSELWRLPRVAAWEHAAVATGIKFHPGMDGGFSGGLRFNPGMTGGFNA